VGVVVEPVRLEGDDAVGEGVVSSGVFGGWARKVRCLAVERTGTIIGIACTLRATRPHEPPVRGTQQ
jgi:hypothetical protein